MYHFLRNAHLLLGLFAVLFLLVYGASAVQMSHHSWFPLKPAVTETQVAVALAAGETAEPRAIARRLMDEHGLRGELAQPRMAGDTWKMRIARPGTVYEVEYVPAAGQARIRASRAGFMGMLNRIHHLGGLWHESSLINAWGLFVAIISLALVLSGLTGSYLWWKLQRERLPGGIVLALGAGGSLVLMMLLRAA